MIYTLTEYSQKYKIGKKYVSPRTILRRCKNGFLPSGHKTRKLPGKTGAWIIEIANEAIIEDIVKEKTTKSMSTRHISWK